MSLTFRIAGIVLFSIGLLALGVPAHAQLAPTVIDETRLTQLYEASLQKGKSDAYLEKRIQDELRKIRKQIDQTLKTSTAALSADAAVDPLALPKALDRQRSLVSTLEEMLSEHTVDLDLLNEEERSYYLSGAAGTGASLDVLRITNSYSELLAKKAILEQRIASLENAISLQNDRLDKLANEQRFQQFASIFGILQYLLIIVAAIVIDRLLRRLLIGKLERNNQRYLATKVLTATVYGIAFLFLLSKLLAEHPNALASLAIVGAGIAVALQSIVKDVVGWLIIIQKRYYSPGDRIAIGQFTGDVIDIGPLRTAMLEVSSSAYGNAPERTGKTLYFPNSLVLSQEVLNYHTTSDFVNAEMKITVSRESDWRQAEVILKELLSEETRDFAMQARQQQKKRTALFYLSRNVGEPEVHLDITENGYLFTLSFTVPIGFRRDVVSRLTRTILDRFQQAGTITVAFNTVRVVDDRASPAAL